MLDVATFFQVNVSLNLRNILEVDEKAQFVSLETTLRMYWRDERIKWKFYQAFKTDSWSKKLDRFTNTKMLNIIAKQFCFFGTVTIKCDGEITPSEVTRWEV